MTTYQQVAAAFNQIGINDNTLLNQSEVIRALDQLSRQRGITQFDRNVADELWNETQKQAGDKVYLRNFINTILKGESLVRASINDLENQVQYLTNDHEKNQKLQDIASYTEDLKYLSVPFGGSAPLQSRLIPQDSRYSNAASPLHNQSRLSGSTVIFAKQIPDKSSGSSTDLKFAFLLATLLVCVQVVAMFHKHHFLSLLALLSVFGIFFGGYFDSYYMKFVKILLFISVLFDIAWLVIHFNEYWTPNAETQHSTLQWAFLKFILLFILVVMFFKLVLAAILFKYRNNTSNMRRNISICGMQFNLDGSPTSPVARIINSNPNIVIDHNASGYNPTY